MVDFLVDFLDFSDFTSLETDFGLSIGSIGRSTLAVFVNAQVPVRVASSGRIYRNFGQHGGWIFCRILRCFFICQVLETDFCRQTTLF